MSQLAWLDVGSHCGREETAACVWGIDLYHMLHTKNYEVSKKNSAPVV